VNELRTPAVREPIRLVVTGLGNIGQRFLSILERKAPLLRQRYGLAFLVVSAADSRGAAVDPDGLDLGRVVALKAQHRSVCEYPRRGRPGMTPLDVVRGLQADALCEATPVNLQDGEPGLGCMRAALARGMHVVTANKGARGMHVVTANKGPLVLAYPELMRMAAGHGVQIRFCGTVAGGLPAVNLGQRDLAGATIHALEALPNLTTSFILAQMAHGLSYDRALAAAQEQGCAEADPSLDVEGWDAACKLVILANSVLGIQATLDDVSVTGITGITQDDIARAGQRGEVIKLVARATRQDTGYALSVAPTPLPAEHPLARLGGQQMGVVYHTDIYGTISAAILETEPIPSAATLLRDLLTIYAPR